MLSITTVPMNTTDLEVPTNQLHCFKTCKGFTGCMRSCCTACHWQMGQNSEVVRGQLTVGSLLLLLLFLRLHSIRGQLLWVGPLTLLPLRCLKLLHCQATRRWQLR